MSERTERHHLIAVSEATYLHVRQVGEADGHPPLLIIHGNRDNHTHFLPLVEALTDRQIFLVDLRGHGLSSPLRVPASPELFASDVLILLNWLNISRAVIVGHSLGSVIAMTFGTTWPERVAGTVLLGSAATFKLSFRRPAVELTEETYPAFLTEANERAAPVFFRHDRPDIQSAVTSTWATISLETHKHLVALEHPDLRDVVPRIPGSLMVIAGEIDRCTSVEKGQWISDHHPRSELVVMPGCAHFMYAEAPVEVASAIHRFLEGGV